MEKVWYGRTRVIERPPIARMRALAERLVRDGRSILDLGQAVAAVPPPQGVVEVLGRASGPDLYGYTPDPGLEELREALADWLREDKGAESARPENVLVTCGANQAFVNVLLALTRPGDKVVLMGPSYFDHDFAVELAGCRVAQVPLLVRGGRYRLWLRGIERELAGGARLVVLVSPSNPTAAVFDQEEIEAVVELCRDWKAWLVSDETYEALVYPPRTPSSAARYVAAGRVVVLGSFSKVYAMAGLRVGFLFGPARLVEETIKVQDAVVVCAPTVSQRAALEALAHRRAYVADLVATMEERRRVLVGALETSRLFDPMPPEGATFVFARVREESLRDLGLDRFAEDGDVDDIGLCEYLLEKTGVLAVPGSSFGPHGRGFVRFSYGNQPVEALSQVAEALGRLEG